MALPGPRAKTFRARWFAYSLSTLLLLTAAVAIWLGVKTNQARRQKAAVKTIEAAGGNVRFDWEQQAPGVGPPKPPGPKVLRDVVGEEYFQDAVEVQWRENKINRGDLRPLADLPKLANVNLNFTNLTDADLAELSQLKSLKHVLLEKCDRVSDAGLAHLANLEQLEELSLMGTGCTDEGVRQYVPQFTRLVYLDVAGIPITNETAKEFRHLKNLKMLHLSRTEERTPHDLSDAVQFLKQELPGCRINYWPPFKGKPN